MNKSNLEFRKIPSLKFLYEISEDGRYLRNIKSKKYLLPHMSNSGYYRFYPQLDDKQVKVSAHRLVAECWLGECPEGYIVDHRDRDKTNNHYSNLRYVTRVQNMANVSEEYKSYLSESAKKRNADSEFRAKATTWLVEPLKKKLQWGDEIFESQSEAARVLAERFNKTPNQVRCYFTKRRSWVLGKPVKYF